MSDLKRLIGGLSGGTDSNDVIKGVITFPEMMQKFIAQLLYGKSLGFGIEGQNLMIAALLTVTGIVMYRSADSSVKSSLMGYYSVLALSMMAQGDALGDTIFSEDIKTGQTSKMLFAVPAATYLASAAYCSMKGGCKDGHIASVMGNAGGLLSAAAMVGAANALLGSKVYEYFDQGDERERDQFLDASGRLNLRGAAARFSDSVATLPGVAATLLVFRNRAAGVNALNSRFQKFRTARGMGGGGRMFAGGITGMDRAMAVQGGDAGDPTGGFSFE